MKIEITEIRLPDYDRVRRGESGQELLVYFKVDGMKFKCQYIQEHYFYSGMPGTWSESCNYYRLEFGEARCIACCNGEFKIPHPEYAPNGRKYVVKAYSSSCEEDYMGDDPRYLNATEEIVLKYLLEPFVERYF